MKKIMIRDIIFSILLLIALIYYFLKYHTMIHITLGVIAIIMITIMLWSECIKSDKQKALAYLLVGLIWIVTNTLLVVVIKAYSPENFEIYKIRILFGSVLATLAPIFLFYKAYKLKK